MATERFQRRNDRRGYSLMEVLLGLVVVVFALYGILDLLAANQKLSARAHRRAVAIELTRAKMAEVQAAGYDAVTALWAKSGGAAAAPAFSYPPKPAAFSAPYEAKPFVWQAQVSRYPQHPEALAIEVRVTWDVISGMPEEKLSRNSVAVGGLLVKK